MDETQAQVLHETLPRVAVQLRLALSNVHLALNRLAPPERRDKDAVLDENAALLEQSYYRLLRLAKDLDEAPLLLREDPLPTGNMDLAPWLADMVRQADYLFALQGVTLAMRCQERYVITAANEHWLSQAMWHLLSNALRATPEGGTVTVSLQVVQRSVLLSVTDTGCGIPAEQQAILFERYKHPEQAAFTGGFGLGLPLAQQVARLHGGQLLLDSHEGGTCATLRLPMKRAEGILEQPASDYAGGFQPALLELADGLPVAAFRARQLDL